MKRVTVGTSPSNDIIVNDKENYVSRKHGYFEIDNDQITYFDTSTNGTILNGKRILKKGVKIKYGTKIVFPDKSKFDWNELRSMVDFSSEDLGSTRIETTMPHIDKGKGKNARTNLIAIAVIFVLSIISFAGLFALFMMKPIDKEKFANMYGKSTVLIVHEVIYTIESPIDKFYIGLNNSNNLTISSNKNEVRSMQFFGTGFIVSDDGNIITNKHVAAPWTSEKELEAQLRNSNFYKALVNRLHNANVEFHEPKLSGETIYIGIVVSDFDLVLSNNTQISDVFTECEVIKLHHDENVDLGRLKIKSGELPSGAIAIGMNNIDPNNTELKQAQTIYMLGFPHGIVLALSRSEVENNSYKIEATFSHGTTSKVQDQYNFQHNLSSGPGTSGSAVYDEHGNVIGVNWGGQPTENANIGFAVKSKYIMDLF